MQMALIQDRKGDKKMNVFDNLPECIIRKGW